MVFAHPLSRREPCRLPPPTGLFLSWTNTRVDVMTVPCCMIVEDQALIGMSLEAFLEDAGFTVAGPFPSCADALRWLEHNTPQVAVLDVSLRDGTACRLPTS